MAGASLSLEDRLKRIVYLNRIEPRFYVGNLEQNAIFTGSEFSTLEESIQNDTELFALLDSANKDPNLPRRSTLFALMGCLMKAANAKPEIKSKITAKVLELNQSDEDFFNFIKSYTRYKRNSKMPSSIEKLVRRFYSAKTPLELAQSAAKAYRMHKWSHKDLLKLAHFKSDTPLKNVVVNYILTRQVSDRASEEELNVLDILRKAEELKKTNEPVNAIPLITALKFTMDQVSPSLHQNGEVWNAAVQNMSIQQILPHLSKLYKLGLLKANSSLSRHLIDLLTSPEKVKTSGVHPIEVFSYWKRFEKGGKPMDPKLLHHLQSEKKLSESDLKKAQTRTEPKTPHILSALSKCFELACSNVPSINKRFFVIIDVSPEAKKGLCIGNKVLTLLEAAVAYTVVLLRAHKDVIIATHNGEKIDLLNVDKKVTFPDLFKKINSRTSTSSWLYAGVDWAASEKRHVDVFINFIHNDYKVPKDKDITKIRCEPIIKYRSKVNLPNAKFVTFAPVKKEMVLWVDTPPNVLDVLGFDSTACKAVECFIKGAFC